MIIVGSNGFARELIQDVYEDNIVAFFDDITEDLPKYMFDRFKIFTNLKDVKEFLTSNKNFYTLGLGVPKNRYVVYKKMQQIGGILTSTVSKNANIGTFDVIIADGVNIMSGAVITSSIRIGKGSLINNNSTISHDAKIGEFVEICPNSNVSGNVTIGDFTFMGANATILPSITIGENVTIGAGCVVTKDIPDNSVVVGVPSKIIKTKEKFLR